MSETAYMSGGLRSARGVVGTNQRVPIQLSARQNRLIEAGAVDISGHPHGHHWGGGGVGEDYDGDREGGRPVDSTNMAQGGHNYYNH